jgi:phosphohistidine phosphatase
MPRIDEGLELYFLRHGRAGARVGDDEEDSMRALTGPGRRDIASVAESLKTLGISFDVIASSPLRRAKDTAKIMAKKMALSKRLEDWDELKPTGDPASLYSRLSRIKNGTSILLVGHEPHMSSVIADIVSGKQDARLVLKKGGFARVHVDGFRPRISGELLWLLTPKLMKAFV